MAHLCWHVANQSSCIDVGELPIVEYKDNMAVCAPNILEEVSACDWCKAGISSMQNALLIMPCLIEDTSLHAYTRQCLRQAFCLRITLGKCEPHDPS